MVPYAIALRRVIWKVTKTRVNAEELLASQIVKKNKPPDSSEGFDL